ncbi:hypothetical protein RD792_001647 [Penstemon davidsonii]|uniref:Uncharacterized protein n=1 Tax=Penstemon davidsonii TaxID=160366 RepID=A0ABR0DQ52_9LAMI|nr:hypothetical protein RD792_001647 [Penstemon davidsonii]
MQSDRTSNTHLDGARDGLQRARPLHGRTSGPTRRSTKGQWTAEEDEILSMAVQRFNGKNWKKIAECFKDRTDVQCLHRWQKVLNPDLVKGPWSKEEDEIIIELVNKYGPKKWSTIAQHLPGRIGKQCRERWHNHLNPNINKEAWTQDEELALIRAHQIYGNKWAELTKFLPGRTDNSIKNHWNSSVKKKLDMYLSSGLLSQFQGPPLVSHPNYSAASSSSKAQQSSEDDSIVKDEPEVEEASECSQGSAIASLSQATNHTISITSQQKVGCRITEESSPFPCSEDYRPPFQGVTFSIPEAPCELNDKFLEHDFSLDWGTFAGNDWPLNSDELPDMSLLDLGQESSGVVMPSLNSRDNHETVHFPPETSMELDASTSMINMVMGSDTPYLTANPDCTMVYHDAGHDGCFPSETSTGINGPADSLLHQSSSFQMRDDGNFVSKSCHVASDMLGTSFPQPLPVSSELSADQYNYSSFENAEQDSIPHDGFIYARESDCSPCQDNSNEVKGSPKLVPANDFVLAVAPSNESQCCSSKDKDLVETDEQKDSGVLFYEPPRFPSLDIPFFNCDLVQSGSDMHQEYSPLGIRQLTISSITPFKLWDSPSRDNSPDAVLKSAAKTFRGTPSILKKRHRDLVSPLSEKRGEKKLECASRKESFPNLSNELCRLEVMFSECVDQKGEMLSLSPKHKRNIEAPCTVKGSVAPACEQPKNEDNESIVISESRMLPKDFNSSECSNKITEQTVVEDVTSKKGGYDAEDVKTNEGGNDAMETAKEFSGILVEHDMNDLLFFSPDRFGIKSDRTIGLSARALANQYSRRLDAASKHAAVLSSAETSCLSVLCSPRLRSMKGGSNLVITTSLQSLSPSDTKVESPGKGVAFENNSIFVETPFRRSMESPSAWKSPWFINTFVPGPRVDTDITIEDIGYFLSPGDRSYDAIGLMKQLGEQTASAFADAQEVLGVETPETIMKGKCFINQEAEKENCSPNSQTEHQILSASDLMTERRTLDFSECGTPSKETGKLSSSTSYSSPSSYLLKGCR